MPPPDLLTAFREHLVDEGIVRKPDVADPDLPPLFLEPRDGAPAPGELDGTENDDSAILSAYQQPGIAPRAMEGRFLRTDAIEIWIRVKAAATVTPIEAAIRKTLIIDNEYGWTMGGLAIVQSSMFRGLQRLSSDEQGYSYNLEYFFQRYAE